MADLTFRKQSYGLLPDDDESAKAYNKLSPGAHVVVRFIIKDPRSVRQHRFFFGALKMIYENTEHGYASFDHFRTAIQCALGWVETIEIKGQSIVIPLSLSFGKMPQDEFNARVNQFEDWVKKDLWPGDPRSLQQMVAEYQEIAA